MRSTLISEETFLIFIFILINSLSFKPKTNLKLSLEINKLSNTDIKGMISELSSLEDLKIMYHLKIFARLSKALINNTEY